MTPPREDNPSAKAPLSSAEGHRGIVKPGRLMNAIYDKTGREIRQGDVLKVFHFVGRRRKRHYMYKQVVGERVLGNGRVAYWYLSHLNQREDGGYLLRRDGAVLPDYEIVQSVDACFEDRPREPTQ